MPQISCLHIATYQRCRLDNVCTLKSWPSDQSTVSLCLKMYNDLHRIITFPMSVSWVSHDVNNYNFIMFHIFNHTDHTVQSLHQKSLSFRKAWSQATWPALDHLRWSQESCPEARCHGGSLGRPAVSQGYAGVSPRRSEKNNTNGFQPATHIIYMDIYGKSSTGQPVKGQKSMSRPLQIEARNPPKRGLAAASIPGSFNGATATDSAPWHPGLVMIYLILLLFGLQRLTIIIGHGSWTSPPFGLWREELRDVLAKLSTYRLDEPNYLRLKHNNVFTVSKFNKNINQ